MPKNNKKIETETSKKIEKILDKIRPAIRLDGGDVELVEVEEKEGIVKVKLTGACRACPLSTQTLHYVVERAIKEGISGIKEVLAV
jgi:Fe-S cluster biogenesis protein NfuA